MASLGAMAKAEMYPQLTKGIYSDSDNKRYIEYLEYISNVRANADGDFVKPTGANFDRYTEPARESLKESDYESILDGTWGNWADFHQDINGF